jgi:hypothetical protein
MSPVTAVCCQPGRRPCSAVTAASGTAAACSKVRLAGLGARPPWRTAMYSAKAPWPKPYTSSPGWNAVTPVPGCATVPARSPPGTANFGLRTPPSPAGRSRTGSPRTKCQSHGSAELARTDTSTSSAPDGRHRHLGQLQDILWRAVLVLHDCPHCVPFAGSAVASPSTLAATSAEQVGQPVGGRSSSQQLEANIGHHAATRGSPLSAMLKDTPYAADECVTRSYGGWSAIVYLAAKACPATVLSEELWSVSSWRGL